MVSIFFSLSLLSPQCESNKGVGTSVKSCLRSGMMGQNKSLPMV